MDMRILLPLLLLFPFRAPVLAQSASVPFYEDASGRIFFRALAGEDSIFMMFNTYATHSKLSHDLEASGKLLKSGKLSQTKDETGRFSSKSLYRASFRVGDVDFGEQEFSLLRAGINVRKAGSLGMETLSRYCWKIDGTSKMLTISAESFASPDSNALRCRMSPLQYPFANLVYDGKNFPVILDWGATNALTLADTSELAKLLIAEFDPAARKELVQGVNGPARNVAVYEVSVPVLHFGPFVLKDQRVVIRKGAPGNFAGAALLREFNAVFNFRKDGLELMLAPKAGSRISQE